MSARSREQARLLSAYAAAMTGSGDVETVERTIPARPEAIFALLASPSRHHDIDGSGTVKQAKNAPERVKLGDKFGMAMKCGVPIPPTTS